MARRSIDVVMQHLRGLLGRAAADEGSDAQLLERYVAGRDAAAFETLMRRHGPMIFSLCRRVVRDEHLAEDVFQAAFLVLARKAGSIRQGQSVGGWLYSVAHRLAVKAVSRACRP